MHHVLRDFAEMYYTPGVYTANESAPASLLQTPSTLCVCAFFSEDVFFPKHGLNPGVERGSVELRIKARSNHT